MDRKTADMLIAMIKGVRKSKQYNQMSEPEYYIDEQGIKTLTNAINALAQGNSSDSNHYIAGHDYPDSYGYLYG